MARQTPRKPSVKRDARRSHGRQQKRAFLAKHLGGVAREARTETRMTQADVAERLGVATEVYGRLERGLLLPSVPTLRKLCAVLRMDANTLLGLASSVTLAPLDEPMEEKQEDSPQMRRLLRHLRKLTPTQLNTVGHVASTLAQSTGGSTRLKARSTPDEAISGGQPA
ncbi:MAG: helix-turn-helix transcriptional regulator [Cystobacter sp.]